MSPRKEVATGDWGAAASVVGLLFIAGPVVGAFSNSLGDGVALAAAALSLPLQLTRLSRAPSAILLWSIVFCSVYLVASLFAPDPAQGLRHTLTAVTATGALLLFANFGREMVTHPWFRGWTYLLIAVGVVGVNASNLSKNLSGGVTLYLVALFTIVVLTHTRRRAWFFVLGFFGVTTSLAFALDFRSLIGYSVVLVLAFFGAAALPKPVFWLVGVVGSVTIITATIWYFLNVRSNELAVTVTRLVVDASGRPATSGRDWLWPHIISTVQQYGPWFGLGPGALPRDIMPTTLSSHSFYIQVYLQLGVVGLTLLIALLLAVWKPLAWSRSTVGWFGAAVFLMFVAHNATEVIMLQNGLIVAIPAWCAIGIAVSFTLDNQPDAVGSSRWAALDQQLKTGRAPTGR